MIEEDFIRLLQIAVGKSDSLVEPLDEESWDSVYAIAKKQSMVGIVNGVVQRLPDDQKPPRRIKIQFALAGEKIARRNALIDEYAARITKELSDMGFRSCLLKGQGISMLYPNPRERQCGDIDMWVDANHKKAVPVLRTRWDVPKVFYHHAEVDGLEDKVKLEVHFRPSWMNNPFTNRRLQKFFYENAAGQFDNFYLDKGFSRPLPGFDCVFGMVHIYRHLLQEGIGMRQFMDYYYILLGSSSEDRKNAYRVLCGLNMKKFIPSVMYVLKVLFNADDGILLCKADDAYGSFLMDEVFKSGNFGRHDPRNGYRTSGNIFKRFYWRMKHLFRYTGLASGEVLWAPVFKTWQLLWRIKNNY